MVHTKNRKARRTCHSYSVAAVGDNALPFAELCAAENGAVGVACVLSTAVAVMDPVFDETETHATPAMVTLGRVGTCPSAASARPFSSGTGRSDQRHDSTRQLFQIARG
jgi:hypothetical protein